MPGARSYCFTINNDTYSDIDELISAPFKYLIIGFETGIQGTHHIQGYIQFYAPVTLLTVKRDYLPRAHIEVAKGNPQQNISYCSKDGCYYEYGVKPTEGGRVTYDQLQEAYEDPENNATIIRLYSKTYSEIKQIKISKSIVKTRFYVIKPEFDAITEILEYLGPQDIVVVQAIGELAAYDSEDLSDKTIILLFPFMDYLIPLYPRGVPIKYKYGYLYHTAKPKNFIVVTDQSVLNRLTGYKKIN